MLLYQEILRLTARTNSSVRNTSGIRGGSNYYDSARCRGCKEHVGKLLQRAAADSGKRSSGKGTWALVDQEAVRGTQRAKMKSRSTGKTQNP